MTSLPAPTPSPNDRSLIAIGYAYGVMVGTIDCLIKHLNYDLPNCPLLPRLRDTLALARAAWPSPHVAASPHKTS